MTRARARILIVEDDPGVRLFLSDALGEYGECEAVESGTEAVAAFHEALDRGRGYDLVCMDLKMPGMDGHQTLERLRDLEQERGVPEGQETKVVVVSGLSDMKNVSRALIHGQAVSYLTKPVTVDQLHKELHKFGFCKHGRA
jgi:two-component system chemotaxis response regulator CheY